MRTRSSKSGIMELKAQPGDPGLNRKQRRAIMSGIAVENDPTRSKDMIKASLRAIARRIRTAPLATAPRTSNHRTESIFA